MRVLTAEQMRAVDRRTVEEFGVPSLQLMENAGAGVVRFLRDKHWLDDSPRCVVVCGKGNNGGDGFVVARLLRATGCVPRVFLLARPDDVRGDAAINLQRWQQGGGAIDSIVAESDLSRLRDALSSANLVIDALLGTGISGAVTGLLAAGIGEINRVAGRARIVAVDMPSGLPSDSHVTAGPVVRADATVTFTAPKYGLALPPACEAAGSVHVVEIGTPRQLLEADESLKLHWLEPQEFRDLPLRRAPSAHKGSYGHALLVAGSRGKTGAAILAASGALRAGAGLVTVATPAPVLPIVAAGLPELMTEPLLATETDSISIRNLDYGHFSSLLEGKTLLAVGPGLSLHPETQQFASRVVAESQLPMILDADGLNAFAARGAELKARRGSRLAVTPHPGEMARLCGTSTSAVQADRLGAAQRAAAEWNAHVILKGYRTIVAAPDGRAFVNPTGNPGMATAGSGDVLTGILAGLTARFGTDSWERVLALGVWLHGAAADEAARALGEESLIASDITAWLPSALQRLKRELGYD